MSRQALAHPSLKYKSPHATDLSFAKDETIRVTGPSPDDDDWLIGETLDGSRSGGFPKDFVVANQPITESVSVSVLTGEDDKTEMDDVVTKSELSPPSSVPPSKSTSLDTKAVDEPKAEAASAASPTSPTAPATSAPAAPAATKSATATSETDNAPAQSMKDRLAFFTAAQTKAGPPPPIKPKPAGTGLTWSQRQKLKEEQEAKERAEREAKGETEPEVAVPAAAPVTAASNTSAPTREAETTAAASSGLSAADAATSIGQGGSLKERMAALRAGGAFGAPAEDKPAPPKPSGKVWARPPAPEPEPVTESEEPEAAASDQPATEGEEPVEQTEEEEEKARRAAIVARMAKLGARGPMGAPPPMPPKPARKPTQEVSASSPVEEKKEVHATTTSDESTSTIVDAVPVAKEGSPAVPETTSPTSAEATTPSSSIPIAAVPRRAAPPRRRAPATSPAVADSVVGAGATGAATAIITAAQTDPTPQAEQTLKEVPSPVDSTTDLASAERSKIEDESLERVDDDGKIEPPPAVMVANEEKPLPKTKEQLEEVAKAEEAGRGDRGAEGAKEAGIAISPVDKTRPLTRSDPEESSTGADEQPDALDSAKSVIGGAGIAAGAAVLGVAGVAAGAAAGVAGLATGAFEKKEPEAASNAIPERPTSILLNKDESPQNLPDDEDELDKPHQIGTVPLHSPAPSGTQTSLDDGDDEVPPPPPPRSVANVGKDELELKHAHEDEETPASPPSKPLGPRPLPSSPTQSRKLPQPPTSALPVPPGGLVPPRADSDEESEVEDEDEEEAPPPPPRAIPPVPVSAVGQSRDLSPGGSAQAAPAASRTIAPTEAINNAEDDEAAPPPPPRPGRVTEGEEAAPPVPQRQASVPAPIQTGLPSIVPGAIATVASPVSPRATQTPGQLSSPTADAANETAPASTMSNEEAKEKARREGIAARLAKLGGVKFGMPPPVKKQSLSTESPTSPVTKDVQTPTSPIDREPLVVQTSAPPIVSSGANEDESPEAEAARRQATLARLRASGTLGFGMFNHGPASAPQHVDERGIQEEEGEAPEVPAGRPSAALPPVPDESASETLTGQPTSAAPPSYGEAEEEDDENEAPPPPPARPQRQSTQDSATGAPPVSAPARQPSVQRPPVPTSPVRQQSVSQQQPSASPTNSFDLRSEPAVMMMAQEDDGPPPPPPQRPSQAAMQHVYASQAAPAVQQVVPPQRTMSTASRTSRVSRTSIESTRGAQTPAGFSPQPLSPSFGNPGQSFAAGAAESAPVRPSVDASRPGYDTLAAASQDAGARLARAARAMFDQGKKAYFGDGSPSGFVLVALEHGHVQLANPPAWGYALYEQESTSVLRRHDEPRPGDIAAFHDARLKGRKGLQSYEQHVGSVEDPLVGVVVEFEQKKHKVKVLQVERGVPSEASYRLDDVKSGRVVVYRPGL